MPDPQNTLLSEARWTAICRRVGNHRANITRADGSDGVTAIPVLFDNADVSRALAENIAAGTPIAEVHTPHVTDPEGRPRFRQGDSLEIHGACYSIKGAPLLDAASNTTTYHLTRIPS